MVRVQRRAFTVDEYYKMTRAGIFTEDDRVELLDGEIVETPPIGSGHASCVDRLTHLLTERLGRRAIVRVPNPVRLGELSEPQPDLALLAPRSDFYAQAHPGPTDVLLLIEVADTTADFDRRVKAPLYARHGVRELWVVDISRRRIGVFRSPSRQGYQDIQTFAPEEVLAPAAFPDIELRVDDIVP